MHADDDSVSIVDNDEVYNFREFHEELRALRLRTECDTEALI